MDLNFFNFSFPPRIPFWESEPSFNCVVKNVNLIFLERCSECHFSIYICETFSLYNVQ